MCKSNFYFEDMHRTWSPSYSPKTGSNTRQFKKKISQDISSNEKWLVKVERLQYRLNIKLSNGRKYTKKWKHTHVRRIRNRLKKIKKSKILGGKKYFAKNLIKNATGREKILERRHASDNATFGGQIDYSLDFLKPGLIRSKFSSRESRFHQ